MEITVHHKSLDDLEPKKSDVTEEEKLRHFTEFLSKKLDSIYKFNKPNVFKRFFNYVGSVFTDNVSTIYDFP